MTVTKKNVQISEENGIVLPFQDSHQVSYFIMSFWQGKRRGKSPFVQGKGWGNPYLGKAKKRRGKSSIWKTPRKCREKSPFGQGKGGEIPTWIQNVREIPILERQK